jgi:hemoglobin/transferrin/lactoferrin receptor protein
LETGQVPAIFGIKFQDMRKFYTVLIISLIAYNLSAQKDTLSALELDEVVVSASKFEQLQRKVPFQIEQITAKQIAFRNNANTADMLSQTGHVFVQKSQGGGGSLILRGFEANRVLMVLDGVRLNNAIFRGGHLQNALRIDQNMLEKVEVLFGPSSVVYGSDALGGVVHFRTRDPKLESGFTGSAYVRYASALNEHTSHLDLMFGGKKWGILTNFTASDFGDVVQGNKRLSAYPDFGKRPFYVQRQGDQDVQVPNSNVNKQTGSAYRQYDWYTKFVFQPSDFVKHRVNVQYSTTNDVPRYDRLTEVRNNAPRFSEWNYGPEQRFMTSYQLEYNRANVLQDRSQLTIAYQDIEESRHTRNFKNDFRKSQIEKVKVFTANYDALKKIGVNEIKYGVELAYNDVNSTAFRTNVKTGAVSNADTRYPDGGSQMQWAAVYLTDQIEIKDVFFMNAGLRYNWFSLQSKFVSKEFFPFPYNDVKQSPNALSGNVGLVYSPTPRTKINAGVSTGFRTPNVDDLTKLFESTAANIIVPNPDIKPEQTLNVEVGVSQTVMNVLRVEANVYRTKLTNAIVVAPFLFNGQSQLLYNGQLSRVTASQNAQSAYLQGISVNIFAKLGPQLTLSANVNRVIGRIKETIGESPLDHIPPTYGRVSTIYQTKRFQAEAFVLYNGWKYLSDYKLDGEDNQLYATADGMPAWLTANVRTSFEVNKYLTLQAACENLLDRNYRTFASGISSAGRNLMLTVRAKI